MEQPKALPSPVFEGSEKRLEVDFYSVPYTCTEGLRALDRLQLDRLLEKVSCPRCLLLTTGRRGRISIYGHWP